MADLPCILVVEDDPILKNLMGSTFSGKYQTVYAGNGAEALALYDQYKPVLILLDLMLPDVDGYTVLEQLRSRTDEGKTVPIIVVSNLSQQSERDRALALGATAHLVKAEVDVDEIAKKVEQCLAAA